MSYELGKGFEVATKEVKIVTLTCEECGEQVTMSYENDFRQGIAKTRELGWRNVFIDGEWHHYCDSDCQHKAQIKKAKMQKPDYHTRYAGCPVAPTFSDKELDTVINVIRGRLWRQEEELLRCKRCQKGRVQNLIKTLKDDLVFYDNLKAANLEVRYQHIPKLGV